MVREKKKKKKKRKGWLNHGGLLLLFYCFPALGFLSMLYNWLFLFNSIEYFLKLHEQMGLGLFHKGDLE